MPTDLEAVFGIHHGATRNALEAAAAVADQFVNDPERSIAEQELARLIARLIRDKR